MWQAFLKKIGQAEKVPFTQVIEVITTVLKPVWESLKTQWNESQTPHQKMIYIN